MLMILNGICQRTQPLDRNLHCISSYKRAHACRSAGANYIAGLQRHDVRDVSYYGVQGKDELACAAGLLHDTVDARLHRDAMPRIDLVRHDGSHWTECVEAFGSRPLAVLLLQVASGNVVRTRIAENKIS